MLGLKNGVSSFHKAPLAQLQVFDLDEIQVKVTHLVQHYTFPQLPSEGTISVLWERTFPRRVLWET